MNDVDEFLKNKVNFALIVHADFSDINELKRAIASMRGVQVVFQKISTNRLRVVEDQRYVKEDER